MKVVINKCFGGFSLSPAAIKRLAQLQGRECYFFKQPQYRGPYEPWNPSLEQGLNSLMFYAFDIPNPNEVFTQKNWNKMTKKECRIENALHDKHSLYSRPDNRTCPQLVQVVEELGDLADGSCAKLAVVEIPDGIDWEIEEYDGLEHIAEKHETWG